MNLFSGVIELVPFGLIKCLDIGFLLQKLVLKLLKSMNILQLFKLLFSTLEYVHLLGKLPLGVGNLLDQHVSIGLDVLWDRASSAFEISSWWALIKNGLIVLPSKRRVCHFILNHDQSRFDVTLI